MRGTIQNQTKPRQFDNQSEDCLTAFDACLIGEKGSQAERLIENGGIPKFEEGKVMRKLTTSS
jgi:hypothetical protein